MNNMFSGKTEKDIPKNLSECIKPDATTTNLHHWAERLENWGKVLFFILIIVGIVTTITDTFEAADINEDTAVGTFISTAISWGLYAFIEYCAYHVLALLISALASITQNTIISANVALYETAKSEGFPITTKQPQPQNSENFWNCKNCGTSNKNEHWQCKQCGQHKANTERKSQPVQPSTAKTIQKPAENTPIAEDTWVCKNCGTHNKYAYGQCKRCGQYRATMSED